MRARALALLVALGTSSLAVAFPALADPKPNAGGVGTTAEQATSHFQRGVELYDEADFRAALIEFRRAHETLPDFRVLYNIAQCEYQLSEYVGALDHFREYLDQAGTRITTQRRSDVERDIRRLEQRVATVRITTNVDGAEISIDEQRVGTSPLASPLRVSAGQHAVVGRKLGYRDAKRSVDVAGGDAPSVSLELEPSPSAARPDPPTGPSSAPASAPDTTVPGPKATNDTAPGPSTATLAWIGTGVLGLGTAVTGVLALGAASDLAAARGRAGTSSDDLARDRTKTTTLALVTDVLGGATVVAGGIALYFTLRRPSAAPPVRIGAAIDRATGAPVVGLGSSF